MRQVGEFTVHAHQFLDADGALSEIPDFIADTTLLLGLYANMLQTRLLDAEIVALQRTGQIGTYAPLLGQEAVGAAIGFALKADDIFVPYYRDIGTQLKRGVRISEILLYWGGDERGNDFKNEKARADFPFCVPVATQVTHAAGVAAAVKIRGEARAVLVTCGDGATSRGDFLESLNLAGVWKLPLVIVINNNQWAISEPVSMQTRAKTLAQKAIAAGIPGEQVDGNDALALYDRVGRALAEARGGHGPTLIEAKTYRLGDHTTADDATRYRSDDDVEKAKKAEPLRRFKTLIEGRGLWNGEKEAELRARIKSEIDNAVREYREVPPQNITAMFDYLYKELPELYREQRAELIQKAAAEGNPP